MNKVKKLVILSACFLAAGCNTENPNTNSINTDVNNMEYDFYRKNTDIVPEKNGKNCYFASDGYTSKRVQGYNHYFYQGKEGDTFTNIVLQNNDFYSNGTGFKNDLITTTSSKSMRRLFVSPYSGDCIIKNPIQITEGESATIEVTINGVTKATKTLTQSLYFELNEHLNIGDEVGFILSGDVTVSYNPCVDFSCNGELLLHTACDGYYGDVHPFYDNNSKRLYMYYLSTGNQTRNKTQTFTSMLTTSSDFLHFSEGECSIVEKKRPEQDLYFVLNVFKDKNGVYRSSQGGNRKFVSSMSSDLHHWENGSKPAMDANGNLTWSHQSYFSSDVTSGRDPDTFYDKLTNKYYTVVLNCFTDAGTNGEKHLTLYVGDSEGVYSTNGIKLIDFTNRGDPECPQIKCIGNRWYLFYSVYGTGAKGNVGKLTYRVGPKNTLPQYVNWNASPEYSLDGADLHAAQVCEVNDKFYAFGWIHHQFNANVWGGYLNLPHEICVNSNGTLTSKLDSHLVSLLDQGYVFEPENNVASNKTLGNVDRNLIKAKISQGSSIKLGNYSIGIKDTNSKKYLYVSSNNYNNEIEITERNEYVLTLVKDGPFLEISCNDEVTLTCHTDLSQVSLNVAPGATPINSVTVSKLADLNYINK